MWYNNIDNQIFAKNTSTSIDPSFIFICFEEITFKTIKTTGENGRKEKKQKEKYKQKNIDQYILTNIIFDSLEIMKHLLHDFKRVGDK